MSNKCTHGCIKGKLFMESLKQFIDCPSCTNLLVASEKKGEEGINIFDVLRIPPAYTGVGLTDKELFSSANLLSYSQQSVADVGGILEAINRAVYNAGVLALSCYIYVPNAVDIKRFVYGVQRKALEKMLTVVPYISLNTLNALQRVGDHSLVTLRDLTYKDANNHLKEVPPDLIHALDGYRLIQETDLTYYDFITADLVLLDATANTTKRGWTALADILGERSKRGLPTYVIGYWGTNSAEASANGLRYLINQSATPRLDLLVPYELKTVRGNDSGVSISKAVPTATVNKQENNAKSGIAMEDLLKL